jgi:hypothetical protein
MRLHLRADDGIRTRDPHLGKVMRYQLRYIRASRTRCRHVRTETIVHPSMATQIPLRSLSGFRSSFEVADRAAYSGRNRRPCYCSTSFARRLLVGRAVPWLSGRASASHAEGRWFDPSRDHRYRRRSDIVSRPTKHVACYLACYLVRRYQQTADLNTLHSQGPPSSYKREHPEHARSERTRGAEAPLLHHVSSVAPSSRRRLNEAIFQSDKCPKRLLPCGGVCHTATQPPSGVLGDPLRGEAQDYRKLLGQLAADQALNLAAD